MDALFERLGVDEAERFIALVQHEKFDSMEWRAGLWEGKAVKEHSDAAMEYRKGQQAI